MDNNISGQLDCSSYNLDLNYALYFGLIINNAIKKNNNLINNT